MIDGKLRHCLSVPPRVDLAFFQVFGIPREPFLSVCGVFKTVNIALVVFETGKASDVLLAGLLLEVELAKNVQILFL